MYERWLFWLYLPSLFSRNQNITMPNKTLKQLIKKNKFDWVHPDINEKNFPLEDISSNPTKLFHFNRPITSEEAIKEMAKEGYRPANAYELLAWDGWNGQDWVVALGSFAKIGGNRYVLYLNGDGSERSLGLGWLDGGWDDFYRFLAIATDSKPLDTLPLELTINGVVYKQVKQN